MSQFDWDSFHNYVKDQHLKPLVNGDTLFNEFITVFTEIYNNSFKNSSLSALEPSTNSFKPPLPWMTPQLIRSCRIKSKLYKLYTRFKTTVAKIKYKTYARELKKSLRIAEINYYSQLFHKNSSIKDIWTNINSLINPNPKLNTNSKFIINDIPVTDNQIISEGFNKFFVNIGKDIANAIPSTSNTPVDYLGPMTKESIFLSPTCLNEIITIIKELDQSACPGPDTIHPSAIKAACNYISPILVSLINYCLEDAIFPSKLKPAVVTPIFKDGDKANLSNYRPISILNSFSKIYEKVISTRLLSFFDSHNILYTHQYGFRKNHSTYMPIVSLTDRISDNLEKRLHTLTLFLDFKKAFDSVDHNILLYKLNHYGIRGRALELLKSYFTGRTQTVKFNNTFSSFQTIDTGVPQGSVLGPLFFLIYINDIVKTSATALFLLFADDTSLINSDSSLPNLYSKTNSDLTQIYNWCSANKIALNLSKTKYMISSPKSKVPHSSLQSLNDNSLKLTINNVLLDLVTNSTFLGIIIENDLSWCKHITAINTKISQVIGVLAKIRSKISTRAAMHIYDALIFSHLNYCNLLWGNASKTMLNPLYILQKRALKICYKLPKLTRTDVLFQSVKKLTLFDINKLQTNTFIYKFNNNLLPDAFADFLIPVDNIHNHNTRYQSSNTLYVMPSKLTVRQSSLRIRSSNNWLQVPPLLKTAPNIYTFTRLYKTLLLSSPDL